MEVPELAADLWQLIAVQADLTILAAGIVDIQDRLGVADTASTFGTAFGVEGFALNEGAAEDIAKVGELGEEAGKLWAQLCHLCGWSMYHLSR